ncbi:hypothetical protein Tco_0516327 [Tanacetum coccineum]
MAAVEDFQDSPDDEEDTRSSHEYLNNLEEEYQERALLAKFKRFFKKRHTKDFEAIYNKIKAKLALLSLNALAPSSSSALMTLTDKERVYVGKESANNGEWVKISIQKVQTLLKMEDNDARKSFLDYLCIDLNYVEEQRNNLMSKHRNLVQELNTCKEHLLVLKQAKLDLLTMQHVNPEILKENQNLRNELKDLTSITEAWLNSSNKVDQSEDSTLSNHDTVKVPSNESQRNTTDHSVVVSNFSATDYDSAHESSFCAPLLSPLENCWVLNLKREALQAKKVESFKASKNESSSALRSKTPTKRFWDRVNSSTMTTKLDKALYGIKQVSKAWYETLLTYLTKHITVRGVLAYILKFQSKNNLKEAFQSTKKRMSMIVENVCTKLIHAMNTPNMPPTMFRTGFQAKFKMVSDIAI